MGLKLTEALELDKAGDWDGAHSIVQQIESSLAAEVHAYLHRVEGDLGNARYWYNRAGIPMFEGNLDEERETLFRKVSTSD